MPLDGVAVAAVTHEIAAAVVGGRIEKIQQPRPDQVLLGVHKDKNHLKVLLCVNASSPRAQLSGAAKENPAEAPMFCMVLRKHLGGGRVISVSQPGMERILRMEIESMNEMGDKTVKTLILEMMGKHSNLILIDDTGRILDSIKRIGHDKSSYREVLPGRDYVLPPDQGKLSPLNLTREAFDARAAAMPNEKLFKFLYTGILGISPVMASELCFQAGQDPNLTCGEAASLSSVYEKLRALMDRIRENRFAPVLLLDSRTHAPIEFSMVPMDQYVGCEKQFFDSPSALLDAFYADRDNSYHMRQKAHDMRHLVQLAVERCAKKKELQKKTRQDTAAMETWRRSGELLTANLHALSPGMTTAALPDFYQEGLPEVTISLDPQLTPAENAQRYFAKYNKAKRTLAALENQETQNDADLNYLQGVLVAIDAATASEDLTEIRRELGEQGFLRKLPAQRGKAPKIKPSVPLQFRTASGREIYVGKSNTQNDWLTLKFAESNDLWFHTKVIPGSHVILKTSDGTASDEDLLAAANLAAYYSQARQSSQVPVDYTQRKNVKKPRGAKPGLVIYEQNRTIYVTPDEGAVRELEKV